MEMSFNVHTLIWLFPIFFIIHDFEEIIMVEKWLTKNRNKLYERLPAKIADRIVKQFSMSTAQFAVAVLFIFLFVSLSTIMANQYLINGIAINIYFFTAITLVFFHPCIFPYRAIYIISIYYSWSNHIGNNHTPIQFCFI